LSERLEEAKASQDDLRRERDDWKDQAQRLTLGRADRGTGAGRDALG
jgi:hypothetical protein